MTHTIKINIYFLLLIATWSPAFGQAQLPGIPAVTNINPNSYPRILPDLSVMFGIEAPHAQQVQIQIGKTYDMKMNNDSLWTCTTDPLDPGFHYYSLLINGVSVSDPASESFYGCGRMSSVIDIPEEGCDFYELKDVPHGVVRSENYYSGQFQSWRPINVYTPPSYDKRTDKKYPVLYIQHGGGEDQRGWAIQGKTATILDNLIAEGKACEMIVVIANGNVNRGYNKRGIEPFIDEMLNQIVPYVEANYRVLTDQKNRAIAGLSMGGGQAFYTGLQHADVFGSVGIFSSGIFGRAVAQEISVFDAEKEIPGLLSDSKSFNDQLQLLYISVGEQDVRIHATKKLIETFNESGLNVTFETFPGDHEWQVWRKSLHSMAMKLFK